MTPELWQRMKPIFHAALDLDPAERDSYLHAACGTDQALRLRVTELLEVDREVGSVVEDATSVDSPGPSPSPSANSDPRFRPGALVLDRFRILRSLGEGGMGEVYEAEDLQLGKVALKTIRAGMVRSPEMVDRFRREVQLARKVSGPQVCRVYELFVLPAAGRFPETAFLTMEFIAGETLARKLARDGPMQPAEALQVARDLCEGLRLIHAQGIVHRDLKCSNIMLAHDGPRTRTVLMDFGLAHDSDAHQRNSNASTAANVVDAGYGGTVAGAMLGTPNYMAPEQFEGRDVSPATDIYALGIVLYELVTGIQPFAAHTPVAAAIRRSRRPAPASSLMRSLPRRWDRTIERCLAYDPADRFQSTAEVLKALEGGALDLRHLRKDRPWLAAAALAASLALLIAFGIWLWQDLQIYRPDAAAKRPFDEGVAALDEGNYIKATRLLEAALAKDPHFVMAHVRLAEAWSGLDFQGNAQRELLLAAPDERRLNSLDRLYLQAIRAGVTGDFAAAARIDEEILSRLHGKDLPAAYVDLGWACERSGDPARALATYRKALDLDKDWPAAWMKIAILEAKQNDMQDAEQAFTQVENLFHTEMNQEGLAELNYQRGYTANHVGQNDKAGQYLNQALDEAAKIPSVQLEIRCLTQLSGLANAQYQDQKALVYGARAVQMARDNHLDAWAADALAHLANVQLGQGHLEQADQLLQEVRQSLQLQPEPRVDALVNLTFASLMNQRHRVNEVGAPAQRALDYYKRYGMFSEAYKAELLLTRTERDSGQMEQAAASSADLIKESIAGGIPESMAQAEEIAGTVRSEQENYPAALDHFERALRLSEGTTLHGYEAAHTAEALVQLGRFDEAEAILTAIIGPERLTTWVEQIRLQSLLERHQYAAAAAQSSKTLAEHTGMDPDRKRSFELTHLLAAAHTTKDAHLLAELATLRDAHQESPPDPNEAAADNLTLAESSLSLSRPAEARDLALRARAYFDQVGAADSSVRADALLLQASNALNDQPASQLYRKALVDTLQQIEHTWPTPSY